MALTQAWRAHRHIDGRLNIAVGGMHHAQAGARFCVALFYFKGQSFTHAFLKLQLSRFKDDLRPGLFQAVQLAGEGRPRGGLGRGRDKEHAFAGDGVIERQPHAPQGDLLAAFAIAIAIIAPQRMTRMLHLHADLMRTARFQADAYQRVSAAARYAPTVQDSFFSLQLQVRGDDLYLIGGLVLLQPVVQGKAIGASPWQTHTYSRQSSCVRTCSDRREAALLVRAKYQQAANRTIHAMHQADKGLAGLLYFSLMYCFSQLRTSGSPRAVALHQHIGGLTSTTMWLSS